MIKEFCKNKRILIIGNAASVLEQERIIPDDMVIVRINRGYPKGLERFIGSRTDILASSIPIPREVMGKNYGYPLLFWCTPSDIGYQGVWLKHSQRYSPAKWQALHDQLGARPTTGCMAVDYFTSLNTKGVYILGFDFFRTPSWNWPKFRTSYSEVHNPEAEEKYITEKVRMLC